MEIVCFQAGQVCVGTYGLTVIRKVRSQVGMLWDNGGFVLSASGRHATNLSCTFKCEKPPTLIPSRTSSENSHTIEALTLQYPRSQWEVFITTTCDSIQTVNMDEDDFNSSDIELPPAPANPHAHRGIQSIEAMIASAFQDRRDSKIQSKTLQLDHGAPGTVVARTTWANRFDAFRVHTLRKRSVSRHRVTRSCLFCYSNFSPVRRWFQLRRTSNDSYSPFPKAQRGNNVTQSPGHT